MKAFTPTSLVESITKLFEANHYEVEGPIQIHGAEVDLIARPTGDPFGVPVYVEATIEKVDNEKYGKDLTKLAMLREKDKSARFLIVSSEGFSKPVRERATATGVQTFTYDELFRSFERFDTYISKLTSGEGLGAELIKLDSIYEEPSFEDSHGGETATEFLTGWRDSTDPQRNWLVIIGEYGTGKTALTKVLQYRWLQEYKTNPGRPIPFRIELREFTRQFDARGLLHHFLDTNKLGHVSVDFVISLIRSGRVILLLDGYDEMAQYLNARERRTCLEALAELSSGGVKGILTSRPNYFTETEELQVFEVLYDSLKNGRYYIGQEFRQLAEREEKIDQLLKQFIERHERILKDLTPEQTTELIKRVLADDPNGRDVVLKILKRVFRTNEDDAISLSGKPVIISYLLEVVEDLKQTPEVDRNDALTEWQVYQLIVDQLMLRDFRRSPEMSPDHRRNFLRHLAIYLSKRDNPVIGEDDFKDLVAKIFRMELNRVPSENRMEEIERYFADLRTSATLTRSEDTRVGWRFSHNSLREYLITEHLLSNLQNGEIVSERIPISDPMRIFASSRLAEDYETFLAKLSAAWPKSSSGPGRGQLLCLFWDGLRLSHAKEVDPTRRCIETIVGLPIALNNTDISLLEFSSTEKPTNLSGASFSGSSMSDIKLQSADLRDSDFTGSLLENVDLSSANLRNSRFANAILVDSDLTDADVVNADFSGIDQEITSFFTEDGEGRVRLTGRRAIGYLKFHGAKTDSVPASDVARHHSRFPIVKKIIEKLGEQKLRQRRGLEQRGAAQQDTPFAKKFIRYLEDTKIIETAKSRKDLVVVTENGRNLFSQYMQTSQLPDLICTFLIENQ